ncbi:(d)CMP kinase [bacterium]|nr:(d)CMP kinase [bacterium]
MTKKITIAIDGYSSCGKSTIAKGLAKALEYTFVDTGAMYRAVTLHMVEHGIESTDLQAVKNALKQLKITFAYNAGRGASDVLLNGKNVENEIREMRISKQVSNYAAIKEVREAMVAQQQEMGKNGGVVMDGRDIGTVVFPHAELKIFMTASPEVRTERRYKELLDKGDTISKEEVRENLAERDHIDSTREESPLRKADDARILDNSNLTMEEQLALVLGWVREV